jgi:predicted PurR-regulated permease PerM
MAPGLKQSGTDMDQVSAASSAATGNPPAGRVDARALTTFIIVAIGALFIIREAVQLFAPVLVSILLAYALEPFVTALIRFRLPRPLAVIVVFACLLAIGISTAGLARRQFAAFLDDLPDTVAAMTDALARGATPAAGDAAPPSSLDRLQRAAIDLQRILDPPAQRATRTIRRVVKVEQQFRLRDRLLDAWASMLAAGVQTVAIAIMTLLLLLTGERLKHKIITLGGPRFEQRKVTRDVIRTIDRQIERYLVARVLISAIVAVATAAGLWSLGVRQPLALGLIAGILNVLPFVGPALAVSLCGLIAFLQFQSVELAAAAVVVSGAIAALEGNLISPWLTSRAGEVNTVAVFVSVVFWGWTWGVWGLVLAVPIVVSLKAAADHIEPLQPLGELLGR